MSVEGFALKCFQGFFILNTFDQGKVFGHFITKIIFFKVLNPVPNWKFKQWSKELKLVFFETSDNLQWGMKSKDGPFNLVLMGEIDT